MADIQPFHGIRYNPRPGVDLGQLLCPPYDIISPEQQEELYQRNPCNAVRLELGRELRSDSERDNRYTRAASLMSEWLARRVLLAEKEAVFYLLQEEFPYLGRVRVRRSLLARVRLEEFSQGTILPHEETSQGPKRDRLELLKATKTNLSPIMGIYRDSSKAVPELMERITSRSPLAQVDYEGNRIRLWTIAQRDDIDTIGESLKETSIYLADGHHRYETALRYREIQREQGNQEGDHDFVMMSLIEIGDPGLVVLPYHRLLKGLSPTQQRDILRRMQEAFYPRGETFGPEGLERAVASLERELEEAPAKEITLGVVEPQASKLSIVTMRKQPEGSFPALERCPTWVLAKRILEPVMGAQEAAVEQGTLHFTHDSSEVLRSVKKGDSQIGFLLPPMPLKLFEEVVLAGERMPIKSTYFSPKLPTGLVINRLA